MGITTEVAVSFKQEAWQGTHALETDVLKIALIKADATGTYDYTTTNYSDVTGNSDEASGTGYTVGGATLANVTVGIDGRMAIPDFDNPSWNASGGTLEARGAIIYNTSQSDKAVAVIDFGEDKTATNDTFTIVLPPALASTALFGNS